MNVVNNMEFKMIKDLAPEERMAWYADDIMKIVTALDDVLTQIDLDDPKEKVQRNLRIVMLALRGVADDLGRDILLTKERKSES